MRLTLILILMLLYVHLFGQADTSRLLHEVVIEAYETDRELTEVPASVGVLKPQQLQRFSNTSILPAANMLPGVRMEERSPGSYRFSIRGSSLRSPFGVRNVKAYWNGLPFTDGGGNTYLNLLDFSSVGSIEIIKGPAASLYGAGTGGVLLMKSPRVTGDQLQASAVVGSYGLQRYLVGGQMKSENVTANIQFAHHRSNGYREQTALKRNALNADVIVRTGVRGTLTSTVLFSNLFYETPGGLTLEQFKEDPAQARPPSGLLGAVQAKAAVNNETIFGGVIYDHDWNNQWTTSVGVYGGSSGFENPTIRNYEVRDETNFGLRTSTDYRLFRSQSSAGGKITFGGEFQYLTSPITEFANDGQGNPGSVIFRDEVKSSAGLIFGQGQFDFTDRWFITVGLSANVVKYGFERFEPVREAHERTSNVVVSPRFAVLRKFSDRLSLFAGYSNGFSPPSIAEVRPSTGTFNNTLKAEIGNNLELGARGALATGRLAYDVVAYDFRLRNTIVLQRAEDGADYFINAGKTSQRGVEALVSYEFAEPGEFVSGLNLWASYAYQHYRFKEYLDFAGNALTGIAPTTASAGLDLTLNRRFTSNITVNYVDHIPLNDANTAFAEQYVLVGMRLGWNARLSESNRLVIFGGIDNLLDERYSLGNDLNAFGGRYYNAAMPRNYYAGLSLTLSRPE